MFSYAKLAYCLILALSGTVGATRQLQMLQQNSYFASRYTRWLREKTAAAIRTAPLYLIAVLCGASFILTDRFFVRLFDIFDFGDGTIKAAAAIRIVLMLFTAASAFICAARAVGADRRSVKPLVFTARVKRLYFTIFLISSVLSVGAAFLSDIAAFLCFCVLSLFIFAPPAAALCALTLNKPIELIVTKYYINDAKKILQKNKNLTVIGVTGSYGKTSTKFVIKRLLDEGRNTVATPGSFNTTLGVVRTIREELRAQTSVFVCEMGAKRRGDVREICSLVHPQIGVITSVGPQHLDTFGSIENVAEAKFELAEAADEVFLNFDNPIIRSRAEKYNHTSYGTTPDCDVYAADIVYGSHGSSFNIYADGCCIPVFTRLLGRHNVLNVTAGVAVAKRMGIPDKAIEYAVSSLAPVAHRLELKSFINGSLLIDDAYNANPEGALEAVSVLSGFEGKKKIIVTPGLIELGEKEYECNFNLGLAAGEKCDIIIFVGEKRSVPLAEGAKKAGAENKIRVVESFRAAMDILQSELDSQCVTLFENDLPDNYLK